MIIDQNYFSVQNPLSKSQNDKNVEQSRYDRDLNNHEE